ncbi:hypothetical protein LX59_00406 [Azomonas agilis]|uniref:Uncharacterized protein n=2 Tax=Azomonas agilis TaxID=116849 RepID=A0A562J2K3_9GAMM|nr:hypothetical protein LX59_00406 [Azomonas agilis]
MLKPNSPWRIPLVRELTIILAIKLSILIGIKAIWFTEPVVPEDGAGRVSERLFGTSEPPVQNLRVNDEEPPK